MAWLTAAARTISGERRSGRLARTIPCYRERTMNIGYELLSISLEVVAFFCVTIDLYGQSRLDTASKKLGSVMDSALRWVTPATSAWVEEIDSTLKVKNTYFQIRRYFLIVGGTVLYLLIMYLIFKYLLSS